jgi:hypothetical protein
MNLHTLDYVILLCEDLARMKAFHHGVLGFPIQRDWEGWIEMRLGAVLLTLRRVVVPMMERQSLPLSPGSSSLSA